MKKFNLKSVCFTLTLLVCVLQASAYNFYVDGIYYDVVSTQNNTCKVTYKTTSYNSYSGNINIPGEVTIRSTTYKVIGVGDFAFADCPNLLSVSIPDCVESIGMCAFRECNSIEAFELPDNLKSIGSSAFENCTNLKVLNLPDGLISLGSAVFYNCKRMTSLVVPEGITDIGSETFYNCRMLKSLVLPKKLVSIGSSAFEDCKSLEILDLPNSVSAIGIYAFWGCSNITSLKLPSSLTLIDNYLFYGCTSLKSVEIQKGVTSIGVSAFQGCTVLEDIIIPSSVQYIGELAFAKCTSLNTVKLNGEGTPVFVSTNTFSGLNLSSVSLGVERKCMAAYEADPVWGKFGNITSEYLTGDANSDKCIDTDDVLLLSDYLLGRELEYFDVEAADLDSSGKIDIADLTLLNCNIADVKPEAIDQMPIACDLYPLGGYMNVEPGGKLNINVITRSTSRKYSTFLFDLKLPEGVNFVDGNNGIVQKGKAMSIDAHIQYEILPDGAVRVLGYNPSLEANDIYYADLLRFTISADTNLQEGELPISISNISFSYRGNVQHSNEHTSILTVANPLPDAIVPISSSSKSNTIITLDGISRPAHVKGVNIIRDSNGTVRKIKSK